MLWEKNNTKDKNKDLRIQELIDLNESVNHFNLDDAIYILKKLEYNKKITCCGEKINYSSAIKHYHGYVDCYGFHESEDYFCSKECINAVEVSEMNKEDFYATFRDCPDLIGII